MMLLSPERPEHFNRALYIYKGFHAGRVQEQYITIYYIDNVYY